MSWSISAAGPADEAKKQLIEARRADRTEPERSIVGAAAQLLLRLLDVAPDDAEISCSASGHVNLDGTGNASISFTAKPNAHPPPEPAG